MDKKIETLLKNGEGYNFRWQEKHLEEKVEDMARKIDEIIEYLKRGGRMKTRRNQTLPKGRR